MDKSLHKVAVTYYTGQIVLLDRFGDFLLLSGVGQLQHIEKEMETFVIQLKPGIGIVEYAANLSVYGSKVNTAMSDSLL